jgi:hypothetical protein
MRLARTYGRFFKLKMFGSRYPPEAMKSAYR